jgi:hypothetical protein
MVLSPFVSLVKRNKYGVRECVLFLCFFLYVWLRISTPLLNQRRDPIFLLDLDFFKGFLDHPGGFMEYIAALFSQLFYFPIVGALAATAVAWVLARLTALLAEVIHSGHPVRLVHYIPVILTLILFSSYSVPLAMGLGLILSLLFALLYLRLGKKAPQRVVLYVIFTVVLYYAAAGIALLYALMCALYEALYSRRPILSAIYLLIAVAVPYLAKTTLFLLDDRMAYVYLLPSQASYGQIPVSYALLLFYPLLLLLYHPFVVKPVEGFLMKRQFEQPWLQYGFGTLLLFVGAWAAAFSSFDPETRLLLRVDYYARQERWQDIIQASQEAKSNLLPVIFQTNRALFHTGRLLENMFSFPQNHGVDGLVMPEAYRESAPLQESDFCYDLGSINESRHWAQEALGTRGETPWILKRLAVVDFVLGDSRAAERCLNVLDKTLFFKNWSQAFRRKLRNPAAASDDETLKHGRSMLLKSDFVVPEVHGPSELDRLLTENPNNRMAFEYRIAHMLLTCRLGNLPRQFDQLMNFHYSHIPRHMEEALIGLWAFTGKRGIPPVLRFIRKETVQHFQEFGQVMAKYGGNQRAAEPELRLKFGDAYWYYMLYYNPVAQAALELSPRRGAE